MQSKQPEEQQQKKPDQSNHKASSPVPPMNPYLAGALIGIAAVLAMWFVELQFGVTPFYGYCSKFIKLAYASVVDSAMYQRLIGSFRVQLHTYFAIGIPIGAALSAWLAGDWKWQGVPKLWAKRFGPSIARRLLWAFIGGFIAVFGVRMAGGCPSGAGMSGIIGLSATGFVSLAAFFIGGIITAKLLYGRMNGGEQGGQQ